MSKKDVSKPIDTPRKGLHIPANQQRVKVEEIGQQVEQRKQEQPPTAVTLEMLYQQNQMLLEQQAYIISAIRNGRLK